MTIEVILRDVTESDLPVFYEHQRDVEACQMAAFTSREKDAFMKHWARILADDSLQKKSIVVNETLAGNVVCFGPNDEREIGYWLGREFWGKGIATLALSAFLAENPGRPLLAHVAKHNIGSLRVLQKCGFSVIGETQGLPDGDDHQTEEYVLRLDK